MIDLTKLKDGWSWLTPAAKTGTPGVDTPYVYGQNPNVGKPPGGPNVPGGAKTPGGRTTPQYADFGAQYDQSGNPSADWMNNYGKGAYNWYDQRVAPNLDPSNPNYDAAYPNMKQNWWFSPEWAQPGGQDVMYNPYAGFQNTGDIRSFYENAGGPATWEQFQQGFTPNQAAFPGWYGDGGGGAGGGTNPRVRTEEEDAVFRDQWAKYFAEGGAQNDAQYSTDPYNPGQLPTPGEWDTASQVAQNYAYGFPTQNPWEWDAAAQSTTNQPWYEAMKGVVQTDTNDQIKQAAEQAGLSGMRWSTPLGRTAQDISGRNMAQLGTQWAGMEQQAKEAAQGRLMQTGSNKAGLQESARDRALQATGLLSQLGGQKTDYARGLAGDLMSGGGQMAGQTNQMAQNIYNQFLKSTPEGNPWLQAALGLGSTPGTPQTYQQSGGSSLLSGLGSLAPLLALK